MLKFIALAGAALLVGAQAAAQTTPASQAAPAPAPRDKDPNRIICERQEEIGTRLGGKKVCKTAMEWQIEREQNRNTIEGVQRQATSTGIPSGSI
jgi:hypothetical protein